MKPNFQKRVQGFVLGSILVCGLVVISGCARGPEGPAGPQGTAGAPGVSLIKEYTGTLTAANLGTTGSCAINVPEILGRRESTFVEVFWALQTAPDVWTPMSDGWTNPSNPAYTSRTMQVSWTLGEVDFIGMVVNDIYLVKVYQNN